MSVPELIIKHDQWRKGIIPPGAPAGVSGGGGGSFSGLDLNLITFDGATVSGATFESCTFQNAAFNGSSFEGTTFSGCDFSSASINSCTFTGCTFKGCKFIGTTMNTTTYQSSTLSGITFMGGKWNDVHYLGCGGDGYKAVNLVANNTTFFDSTFENSEFKGCSINADDTDSGSGQGQATESEAEYDEAIEFTTREGKPIADVPYSIELEEYEFANGTTDKKGRTERIRTSKPKKAIKAKLFTGGKPAACCSTHTGDEYHEVTLRGVKTNPSAIDSSVVTQKVEDLHERPLTSGETQMAKFMFKDAINYSKVKVHNHGYLGGLENGNAMTPAGEIYFPKAAYRDDFAMESGNDKILFIHEMVHVWQYQMGYSVKWAGLKIAAKGGYSGSPTKAYVYDYTSKPLPLSAYNMEQQGDLIANYFAAVYLKDTSYIKQHAFLAQVLREFLGNPKNAKLLPITTDF